MNQNCVLIVRSKSTELVNVTAKLTASNAIVVTTHLFVIMQEPPPPPREVMLASNEGPPAQVVYPVVIVIAEGIKCRALFNTGAGGHIPPANLYSISARNL